jgi:hypothetical protein
MKPRIYLLILALPLCGLPEVFPQENAAGDFVRRFYDGSRQFANSFGAYADSVNLEFAGYLARSWESFNVEAPNVHLRKPAPREMPIYIPGSGEQPPADTPVADEPDTEDTTAVEAAEAAETVRKHRIETVREPESSGAEAILFFGTPVRISPIAGYQTALAGTDEKHVAAYWTKLAKTDCRAFIGDLNRKANALELGSWGLYYLICEWANAHFAPQRENEKTVFTVYMLNRAGYKAKIGRIRNTLVVMMPFRNTVYGKNFIRFGQDCYYILSDHAAAEGLPVSSYRLDCSSAVSYMDLRIRTFPRLDANACTVERTYRDKTYAFRCDRNLADYLATFPQTELGIYAAAPLSPVASESIKSRLDPELQGKSPADRLKFLLAFVQYGFLYQTDEEQFGQEKFFFPEETIFYPYSDCEDRAALFCRMVKLLCGLDTLLIEYPTHVAAAVKFDAPGDAILYRNERYIVCDPTYIGAPIARTMKGCDNATAKIISPDL